VIDGRQDRGGERADRLFGATAGAQAVKLRLEIAGLLAGGGPNALDQGGLEPRSPLRIRVDSRLPALSSFFGHRPAQEIKCPAVGKRLMSRPISARMT
jgi:hypothetical protein